jgi:choline-sulfatase
MKRNFFITAIVLSFGLLVCQSCTTTEPTKPNVLIIMTDQQFADAMSCVMGNEFLHTPNMDLLAESGIRFTRAYSPNPLCTPARCSIFTGDYPHKTGVQDNSGENTLNPENHVFMGKLFKDAGYETAYLGKWHISLDESLNDIHGFDRILEEEGRINASPAAAFLKQKHEKPFLAIASFLSPHEICQWSRKQELPGEQLGEVPPLAALPPLKNNFEAQENETDIMTFMRKSYQAHRLFPVGDYTEYDWRRLAWGYYRLIERADDFVGEVMNALQESGQDKNTIVLFLSDHGDCIGSHRWNQKTVFYDESSRVPFILSWPENITKSTSDALLNTGVDIIPTLCDLASVRYPSALPGKSFKQIALGRSNDLSREFIVSENHMIQGEPVDGMNYQPHGRMVRSNDFKYCLYSEGKQRESLVDMKNDPLEMVNLAKNPVFKKDIEKHRKYLEQHAIQNNDSLALDMLSLIFTKQD